MNRSPHFGVRRSGEANDIESAGEAKVGLEA